MRTVGLIVEYNPFHNGHLYHLQQSRKIADADAVVAVMSGHFLQRGEPALADKWTRTATALSGGCDLVIELPVAYATHAAEWFAYGAVALLEATGIVDAFCFGTESGELAPLQRAASQIAQEPPAFKALLKAELQRGISYPRAYSTAVANYLRASGDEATAAFPFDQPNHTLGLHYLLARERIGGAMTPLTIAREKSDYNQRTVSDGSIASATAIRKLLFEDNNLKAAEPFVPPGTYERLSQTTNEPGGRLLCWEHYAPFLLHSIAVRSHSDLARLHGITEGLEHRLLHSLPQLKTASFEELLALLQTKRYTRTKLQRALLSILLNHAAEDFSRERLQSGLQYIRILGFTEKGRLLLKKMRKTASLPVLLSAARPPGTFPYLQLDINASGVYMLGDNGGGAASMFRDYREQPLRG